MRRTLAVLVPAFLGLTLLAAPAPTAAASTTISIRAATFNVRTARETGDRQTWLQRAPEVAHAILARNPGVVMLQELGPGRADGKIGGLDGHVAQTTSLTNALSRLGGSRYKLVRTTPYIYPGEPHATEGARILYDSSRYRLLSHCPQMTNHTHWNPSCSFDLPLAAGDSKALRRSAAYAKFAQRKSGREFWVVSTHLDKRHSTNKATEAKFDRLRARQAAAVVSKMASLNTQHLPVIFGADMNSWQTDSGHYAPHRQLVADGYADAVSAKTKINWRYPTITKFRVDMVKTKSKYGGSRLDAVMVKGAKQFTRWENMMANPDRTRPSDHNMVVADFRI